jgi:hypothetical protein
MLYSCDSNSCPLWHHVVKPVVLPAFSYSFNFDGKPALAVAFVNASTLVLALSKVTTASAFSRLTSALLTPFTLVNDLFTEIAQEPQVIPDTASVIVLVAVQPEAEYAIATAITTRAMKFFIFPPSDPHSALLSSTR